VDNKLAFTRDGLRFRRATEDSLDVRTFWLDVYFGGSTIPNDRNLTMRIDDLAVSDTGRIGCPNRFRDDDGNPHESDIEWMFQREYIYGCDTLLYCPSAKLTRAATAALIDRILQPPATSGNSFTDDNGHWAGILRGCGEALACPDEPVTRGQFAALLSRAFAIPGTSTDHFVDDDGNIFESAINSIAEIGITKGCHNTDDHYCPGEAVLRDQAATLLARTVRWWEG
jgi:hypothetical protein